MALKSTSLDPWATCTEMQHPDSCLEVELTMVAVSNFKKGIQGEGFDLSDPPTQSASSQAKPLPQFDSNRGLGGGCRLERGCYNGGGHSVKKTFPRSGRLAGGHLLNSTRK